MTTTGSRTRIGMVGAGFIAGRHARNLAAMPDVELVGITDARLDRAGSLARQVGSAAFANLGDLLEESLDGLYVCVPPAAHGELELSALERGVGLFVEKPLSTDLETAELVAAAVERSGLPVSVGYHWRYLDTVERARDLLAERPARLVLGAWLDKAPGVDWWAQQQLSGGQMVEQATHLIDLARYLVGEVEEIAAVGGRAPDGPGNILHASTSAVTFETGAVGSFSTTCLLRGSYRMALELFAPGLTLCVTADDLVVGDGGPEARTYLPEVDPMVREDRAFVDALQGDGSGIRCSYAEALRTHRVALTVGGRALESATASAAKSRSGSVSGAEPAVARG